MTAAVQDVAVVDMTNEAYHALPSLSSSGARKLLPPSCPALFKWERDHPVFKKTFDFGSAAHKMVLGDPLTELVIFDIPNWLKKADQQRRQEAREAGQVPILRLEYDQIVAMAAEIRSHPIAGQVFNPAAGRSEQSLFWTDEATGVDLRIRLDWLPDPVDGQRTILADYKTSVTADPRAWSRSAANYGYAQQAAFYIDGVRACGLDPDPVFLFVVQMKEPPYLVSVVELEQLDVEVGRQLNRKAIDIYAECLRTDTWPGYSDGVELVSLPGWYGAQYEQEDDES